MSIKKKQEKRLIVALDIGTSKIAVLVGEINEDGHIALIGIGTHPSQGLKRGVVINIEATVQSIRKAIEAAELMAGCTIHSVYTGIAGNHIRGLNSHGIVAIQRQEVMSSDVERVIDAAKAVAIPADQQILHILPQEFIIDGQEGIREPIGMSGVRLETRVHLVTGAVSASDNIVKCVRQCGLEVADIILEPLAASYAVLTEDEKELGVCLVDIGGGTTDIAIFTQGAIRHTAVIPIAGDQVTNDVAVAFRTPTQCAEIIKIEQGSACLKTNEEDSLVDIPSMGDRPQRQASRRALIEVMEARYGELFYLVQAELRRSGFEHLIASGIVLTGGASDIPGVISLAESIFQMPVHWGLPQPGQVSGLVEVIKDPRYATAVGLLLYGFQQEKSNHYGSPRLRGGVKSAWGRVCEWVKGNF